MEGWIKLHRRLIEWQWIDSYKHVVLFLHLLLRANHKETKWRNVTIGVGQLLTGRKQLSKWSGLSEQSIRTVLSDLKSTSEITIKTHNKFSIISITNWCEYQQANQKEIISYLQGLHQKTHMVRYAGKIGYLNSILTEKLSLIHISEPTRPY